MSKPSKSDKHRFERELSHYRSLAKANKSALDGKPFLAVQINFWMESVRFLITELEVWEYMGNPTKYHETINKIDKALHYVHRLILYLEDENSQDYDPDPEI